MNSPFFSIIVVCKNAGERLDATVASILAQTYGDYEIVVKDALSDDGAVERLPRDPRIRLVRRSDKGIYDGMNEALVAACGIWILFLNCGDVFHSEHVLEEVQEIIRAGHRRDAIWYGDVLERTSGQIAKANPRMDHFAMFRNLPSHQACFYDRSLFRDRAFDTAYKVRADYEHFLYCVMERGASAIPMDVVIADYEGGGYSETEEGRALSREEHKRITGKYFTPWERILFRGYLLLSLQPLREKLAHGRWTAGLYAQVKSAMYHRK